MRWHRLIIVRRLGLLILLLALVHVVMACSLWDRKNKDLPEKRKVKTVVFPVRVLKFENLTCTQQFENLEFSGTVINISPISLLNLRIQVEVFMAGEDDPRERFFITGAPSPFLPDTSADFTFSETVDKPVASVELHAFWGDPY